jgi:hypothetical protein
MPSSVCQSVGKVPRQTASEGMNALTSKVVRSDSWHFGVREMIWGDTQQTATTRRMGEDDERERNNH